MYKPYNYTSLKQEARLLIALEHRPALNFQQIGDLVEQKLTPSDLDLLTNPDFLKGQLKHFVKNKLLEFKHEVYLITDRAKIFIYIQSRREELDIIESKLFEFNRKVTQDCLN